MPFLSSLFQNEKVQHGTWMCECTSLIVLCSLYMCVFLSLFASFRFVLLQSSAFFFCSPHVTFARTSHFGLHTAIQVDFLSNKFIVPHSTKKQKICTKLIKHHKNTQHNRTEHSRAEHSTLYAGSIHSWVSVRNTYLYKFTYERMHSKSEQAKNYHNETKHKIKRQKQLSLSGLLRTRDQWKENLTTNLLFRLRITAQHSTTEMCGQNEAERTIVVNVHCTIE